jgi:hypothetical protein
VRPRRLREAIVHVDAARAGLPVEHPVYRHALARIASVVASIGVMTAVLGVRMSKIIPTLERNCATNLGCISLARTKSRSGPPMGRRVY